MMFRSSLPERRRGEAREGDSRCTVHWGLFGICIHNLGRGGGGERREEQPSHHLRGVLWPPLSLSLSLSLFPSACYASPHKGSVFDRNAALVTECNCDSMDGWNQMDGCHMHMSCHSIGKRTALLVNCIVPTLLKTSSALCLTLLKCAPDRGVHILMPSCQISGNFFVRYFSLHYFLDYFLRIAIPSIASIALRHR